MKHLKEIRNKRASYDYQILDRFQAGIILKGYEVKAIRQGRVSLTGAYVSVNQAEVYLKNLQIFHKLNDQGSDSLKLLLTKKQIQKLIQVTNNQKRSTIVVIRIIMTRYIKVEIGIGIGKRKFDKRQALQAKQQQRTIDRQLKRK